MNELLHPEAIETAKREIKLPGPEHGVAASTLLTDAALLDEFEERSWGWVFYFNSVEFSASGDPLRSFGGNAPVYVHRLLGVLDGVSGTAQQPEVYLKRFENDPSPYSGLLHVAVPPHERVGSPDLWTLLADSGFGSRSSSVIPGRRLQFGVRFCLNPALEIDVTALRSKGINIIDVRV